VVNFNTLLLIVLIVGLLTVAFTFAFVLLLVIYHNTKTRDDNENLFNLPYSYLGSSGNNAQQTISLADLLRMQAATQPTKKEEPKAGGGTYI
jgi:hypothetical protein